MILTLLTTSIIGGTFAKYTTTGSASDTARVAKWGVVINTSGSLYSNAYADATAGDNVANLPKAWTADANTLDNHISVATATNADGNIVAPGTKSYGNGLSFSISGTPEVAVKISTTVKAEEDIYLKPNNTNEEYGVLVLWTPNDVKSLNKIRTEQDVYKLNDSGDGYTKITADADALSGSYYILTDTVKVKSEYHPVIYKFDGKTGTAQEIAKEIAEKVHGSSVTEAAPNVGYTTDSEKIAANTNLATDAHNPLKDVKLEWEWPFDDITMSGKNDGADTILGDLIAAKDETSPKYVVVAVDTTTGAVTKLEYGANDTVTKGTGGDIVANLQTKFDISLTVTQVD